MSERHGQDWLPNWLAGWLIDRGFSAAILAFGLPCTDDTEVRVSWLDRVAFDRRGTISPCAAYSCFVPPECCAPLEKIWRLSMERRAFLRTALAGAGFIAASRTMFGAKQCGTSVQTMTPMGEQPIEVCTAGISSMT